MENQKIYKRRDSITAILRRAGIAQSDYHRYIEKVEGGFKMKNQGRHGFPTMVLKVAKVEEPAKAEKPKRVKGKTVSSVAREMILAGATNKEVWEELQRLFGLDDKKRGYPAWYRSDLRRKGMI